MAGTAVSQTKIPTKNDLSEIPSSFDVAKLGQALADLDQAYAQKPSGQTSPHAESRSLSPHCQDHKDRG